MALCKKLSARTVFGSKADIQKLVLDHQDEAQVLYRVYGQVTGFVTGNSKFDDREEPSQWTGLVGDFEAINRDGEVWNAAICFLPTYIVGSIVERLKLPDVTAVEIAYDIYAKYDDKAATSYIYLAQPLRKAGEDSPLDRMRKELPAREEFKALAAPKKGKNKE